MANSSEYRWYHYEFGILEGYTIRDTNKEILEGLLNLDITIQGRRPIKIKQGMLIIPLNGKIQINLPALSKVGYIKKDGSRFWIKNEINNFILDAATSELAIRSIDIYTKNIVPHFSPLNYVWHDYNTTNFPEKNQKIDIYDIIPPRAWDITPIQTTFQLNEAKQIIIPTSFHIKVRDGFYLHIQHTDSQGSHNNYYQDITIAGSSTISELNVGALPTECFFTSNTTDQNNRTQQVQAFPVYSYQWADWQPSSTVQDVVPGVHLAPSYYASSHNLIGFTNYTDTVADNYYIYANPVFNTSNDKTNNSLLWNFCNINSRPPLVTLFDTSSKFINTGCKISIQETTDDQFVIETQDTSYLNGASRQLARVGDHIILFIVKRTEVTQDNPIPISEQNWTAPGIHYGAYINNQLLIADQQQGSYLTVDQKSIFTIKYTTITIEITFVKGMHWELTLSDKDMNIQTPTDTTNVRWYASSDLSDLMNKYSNIHIDSPQNQLNYSKYNGFWSKTSFYKDFPCWLYKDRFVEEKHNRRILIGTPTKGGGDVESASHGWRIAVKGEIPGYIYSKRPEIRTNREVTFSYVLEPSERQEKFEVNLLNTFSAPVGMLPTTLLIGDLLINHQNSPYYCVRIGAQEQDSKNRTAGGCSITVVLGRD